jgi:hypothetical protein
MGEGGTSVWLFAKPDGISFGRAYESAIPLPKADGQDRQHSAHVGLRELGLPQYAISAKLGRRHQLLGEILRPVRPLRPISRHQILLRQMSLCVIVRIRIIRETSSMEYAVTLNEDDDNGNAVYG